MLKRAGTTTSDSFMNCLETCDMEIVDKSKGSLCFQDLLPGECFRSKLGGPNRSYHMKVRGECGEFFAVSLSSGSLFKPSNDFSVECVKLKGVVE